MAWRSGSLSRSLVSTARASLRPSAPSALPRLRPPPLTAPRVQSRRFSMPATRFRFSPIFCESGAIGLHTITFTSAKYNGYYLLDVTRCCQCSCLLRAVPWYLPSFLSRSLVVSLEWKRWVMRQDIDHLPMAREECCIVREEAVEFS
ncbi:hypothetical protein V8G54_029643 [Vigna mungo]|uniref:Uncharacterized protein n=1 Tax=Vigna mungo TaxID=3915 RepID=A0AAQ3MUN5_VIGMU